MEGRDTINDMKELIQQFDIKKRAHAKVQIDLRKFEEANLRKDERQK
jgi:hypothetical protein